MDTAQHNTESADSMGWQQCQLQLRSPTKAMSASMYGQDTLVKTSPDHMFPTSGTNDMSAYLPLNFNTSSASNSDPLALALSRANPSSNDIASTLGITGAFPAKNQLSITIPTGPNGSRIISGDSPTALNGGRYPADLEESGGSGTYPNGEGSPHPSMEGSSKRRQRLRPDQTRRLMEIFKSTPKPDADMRKMLGKQLGMNPRTVQVWFQNRRAKIKRESNNASNHLKNSHQFNPAGPYSGNPTLTYTRRYLNRRMTGCLPGDGFEHLQGNGGFQIEQHSPTSICGLPLQNPSQVPASVSMGISVPPSMQSPHANNGGYGNLTLLDHSSAMGIPAAAADTPRSASILSSSVPSSAPSVRNGGSGANIDHMFNGMPPPFISGQHHNLPPYNELMCSPSANSLGLGDGHHGHHPHNTRSITADSHMLANLSRMGFPMDGNGGDAMANANTSTSIPSELSIAGSQLPRQSTLPRHFSGPLTHMSASSDVPTLDSLVATRQRHLQDMKVINQTDAARNGVQKGNVTEPTSSHGTNKPQSANSSTIVGLDSNFNIVSGKSVNPSDLLFGDSNKEDSNGLETNTTNQPKVKEEDVPPSSVNKDAATADMSDFQVSSQLLENFMAEYGSLSQIGGVGLDSTTANNALLSQAIMQSASSSSLDNAQHPLLASSLTNTESSGISESDMMMLLGGSGGGEGGGGDSSTGTAVSPTSVNNDSNLHGPERQTLGSAFLVAAGAAPTNSGTSDISSLQAKAEPDKAITVVSEMLGQREISIEQIQQQYSGI